MPDLLVKRPDVSDGLDDVPGPSLTLRADHAATLGDAAQCLAQVPAAAHERHLEPVLVHVVALVRDGQDLALVDAVDAQLLQNLGLDEVADAALGHDGNGHGRDDLLDHPRVRHPGDALLLPNVGGDALESHDGAGPRLLRDLGLLGVHDVHDDAALEHCGKALLHALRALADGGVGRRHCCGGVQGAQAKPAWNGPRSWALGLEGA
mmetsp:Transcript_8486/g.27042  ORF Transcript_8486/g.27042 Transcript_8486/m.27042 type:complete len:207 (-) Transcript_8486:12-632(-)